MLPVSALPPPRSCGSVLSDFRVSDRVSGMFVPVDRDEFFMCSALRMVLEALSLYQGDPLKGGLFTLPGHSYRSTF